MQFAIHLSDKQRHLMTESLLRSHVDYLRRLTESGALQFCGPCHDGTALMIMRCGSEAEARALVEGDPFSQAGYYRSRRIVGIDEANMANGFLLDEALEALA